MLPTDAAAHQSPRSLAHEFRFDARSGVLQGVYPCLTNVFPAPLLHVLDDEVDTTIGSRERESLL